MNGVGTEVECAEQGCTNRFVRRSPAHKYCDRCKRRRRAKSNQLHYEIKGADRRKELRKQKKDKAA